ncbi:hypothetical protein IW261DRAFT_1427076 [Armillaria novae-zelandiae]|uniref:Uncharacterized protein n=1 Tax=Armillaria novae-zelandiae TaxID=153914 RepID=A0AA39NHI7_9AGAR|nr:hypothetical protein IW261DRAFT_1427076 [Armillaria novae-zelandiae]
MEISAEAMQRKGPCLKFCTNSAIPASITLPRNNVKLMLRAALGLMKACHEIEVHILFSITKPTKTLTQIILDCIACKNDNFMALIQQCPHAYAEQLYLGFIASVTADKPQGDDSQICTEITKIGELIDAVNKYKARILNLAGVRPELAEAHEYQDCMEEVQQWLEDILYGIMEGVEVLFHSHESHQLLYQQSFCL